MKNEIIINNVTFHCPNENGNIFVPIKPICEALGVAHQVQQEVIKKHPIWSTHAGLKYSTGSDGKQYKMLCIPLKYAFGWIMSIDARLVKPESYQSVIAHQEIVYNALYSKFFLESAIYKMML